MLNVTNRCNLRCTHCYLYEDGNPNDPDDKIPDDEFLDRIREIRDRHGLMAMVWMGGEPMIRWRLVERGVELFARNTITTNGTIPLKDFGPTVTYVVSLDGPADLNDELRGADVYAKAIANIAALPKDFSSTVQVQCVTTRQNQDRLEELLLDLIDTRVDGIAFSFYCPDEGKHNELSWRDAEHREAAVDIVLELKKSYPRFVWNSTRALELMRAATAKLVTDNCPAVRTVLPLYVDGDGLTNPRCCHGNNVDCDRCGGWVVFSHAAKLPGPWDEVLPPVGPYDHFLVGLMQR